VVAAAAAAVQAMVRPWWSDHLTTELPGRRRPRSANRLGEYPMRARLRFDPQPRLPKLQRLLLRSGWLLVWLPVRKLLLLLLQQGQGVAQAGLDLRV